MHDNYLSRTALIAGILWLLVVSLIGGAWLLMALEPDHWKYAGLMAGTGCALSAIAAVAHLKLYSMRLCALIRATRALEDERGGLRSVGR